jgi:hypothetical protein
MVDRIALCAALMLAVSLALPSPAQALCRDDLTAMKPRIDHEKAVDKQRYYTALKWWGRAQEVEPGDEVACLNYLARARKALVEPIPAAVNCNGPNAYLPACANGGGYGAAEPVMAIGAGGFGGGGGGAAAAQPQAVQPVAPVTANPPPTFTPPGSIGSPSITGR